MTESRKLAVFDIDGTLFRNNVTIALVEQMAAEDLLPADEYRDVAAAKEAWQKRQGSWEDYVKRVVALVEKDLNGFSLEIYQQVARQVISVQRDYVYRYTRDLFNKLSADDYVLIVISGMLQEALEIVREFFPFQYVFGTEVVIKDGMVTDQAINLDAYYDKAKVLKRFLKEHPEVTLKDSVGVGDTEGDAPYLERVEQPIAFNPNRKLFEIAEKQGWEIVVERKDMIYGLHKGRYSVKV